MYRVLSTLLTLAACCSVQAEDVVVESSSGEVNWTEGVVYAQGFGTAPTDRPDAQRRLMSRRAAVVDSQRSLLEMTKGVRITSLTKVVDAMLDSSVTASRVQGVVTGAVVTKESYQNDIYAVTMAMPLAGGLLQAVYDRPTGYVPQPTHRFDHWLKSLDQQVVALETWLLPRAYAADPFVIENDKEARAIKRVINWISSQQPDNISAALESSVGRFETGQFSGLLVNASGVAGFELATVPQIRDEEGNVIYPSDDTSYDDIVNKRGVSYDFDLEDAVRNKRVARVPLIVNAVSTYKNLPSDLVISKADAAKIVESNSTRSAMNKAGVLIVVPI